MILLKFIIIAFMGVVSSLCYEMWAAIGCMEIESWMERIFKVGIVLMWLGAIIMLLVVMQV